MQPNAFRRTMLFMCKHLFILFTRDHQPVWNWELFLRYRLMQRATNLTYISLSETNIFLTLFLMILSSTKLIVIIHVNTTIMFNTIIRICPRTTNVPVWATWCPRAPRWWPRLYSFSSVIQRNQIDDIAFRLKYKQLKLYYDNIHFSRPNVHHVKY